MNTQAHHIDRSLSLHGQCAFVRAAIEGSSLGMAPSSIAMNEEHPVNSPRPVVSLGYEDWMHPGKEGA